MGNKKIDENWNLLWRNSELRLIDKQNLRIDKDNSKKSKRRAERNFEIVAKSVIELGYQSASLPLIVYADPEIENSFIVLDGKNRFLTVLETELKELQCLVINNLSLSKARLLAQTFNSFIFDIRDKLSLGELVINFLDQFFRVHPYRVDLALTQSSADLLKAVSGKSAKTVERILRGVRMINKAWVSSHPERREKSVKETFKNIIASNEYPFLRLFLDDKLYPKQFEDLCVAEFGQKPIPDEESHWATMDDQRYSSNGSSYLTPTEDCYALIRIDEITLLFNYLRIERWSYDQTNPSEKFQAVIRNFALAHPKTCDLMQFFLKCLDQLKRTSRARPKSPAAAPKLLKQAYQQEEDLNSQPALFTEIQSHDTQSNN